MLDIIVALLGVDQEVSADEKRVELSFNEELAISIEIVLDQFIRLEFDIGDQVEDKEVNEYLFMNLAQVCASGYFHCPSWLVQEKQAGSFFAISKLKIIDIPEPLQIEYIDNFLALCNELKQKYHEVSRKIIH